MAKGNVSPGVDASPTKRFFVEMLTRDIDLQDAVLDLLDNCIDGILRHTHPNETEKTPYKKYHARISFSEGGFSIKDNCGGISKQIAQESAFRLGRPKASPHDGLPTVGIYGIGMKRAIFKMGRRASVTSVTDSEAFRVSIDSTWLESDTDWLLPITDVSNRGTAGTTIEVHDLYAAVAQQFRDSRFAEKFKERVATHYGMIIHKGFEVSVNGSTVTPTPVKFLLNLDKTTKRGIAPFLYEGTVGTVHIHMVVGFYRPTPTEDELDSEQNLQHRKDEAGWTVVCNDRVVLYCDKSMLTGWGDAGVPGFHTQFIAIAGIVEFRSTNAADLPVTTTKRGIEASSEVYSFAKNYMREGMKIFTNYTYKWKSQPGEQANVMSAALVDPKSVRQQIPADNWTKISKNKLPERKFVPVLPAPKAEMPTETRIRFSRPPASVRRVSAYLFGDESEHSANEVGAKAFDWVHKKAKP
jgi:hypothetical protein